MRARWLKPEFFTDKKVATLGPVAALVFQALWCMADDGGTAPCDADTVKAQMFYRWSAVGVPEITEALHALAGAGRIVRYQVGDDQYASIPTWDEHQQVHKPSKFRHPTVAQGVALAVPGECGTGAAPLPASPPPRHLDSQTPRHPPANAGAPPVPVVKRIREKQPPAPWMGKLNATWKRHMGGNLPDGSATALRPVVGDVGEDEANTRLDAYLERTDPDFVSLRTFVAKHGTYGDKLAVDPATGVPNAIGVRALGGRR